MSPILSFNDLLRHVSDIERRVRVVSAQGSDASSVEALAEAMRLGFCETILVGERPDDDLWRIWKPYEHLVKHIPTTGEDAAAEEAVAVVRRGEGDVLMKGLLHTDNLLRAVLNKEKGLLPKGRVLSHVTVGEIPGFPRLLFFSDVAVLPEPTAEQRLQQVRYVDKVCRAFGIAQPRIGLVHFTEKVSPKFPLTADYRSLAEASARGEWGTTIIDGPLDVRTCVDAEALRTKGIASPLGGKADALIFPNLEAANTFYKTITYFAKATVAGILQGTDVPIVLTSRGDDSHSKLLSLATAAILNHQPS